MKITTKIISAMLSVMLIVACMPVLLAAEEVPISLTALATKSTVLINGVITSFEAYNIKDNNYVKLRDIAQAISDTEKQFDVSFDEKNNAVALTSDKAYTTIGGELNGGDGTDKTATSSTSNIVKDGETISLAAYLVNDNNYFKLRDLGQTFNFEVSWDAKTNIIIVDTAKSYTGANASAKDYITFYENYSDVPDMGAMMNLPVIADFMEEEDTIDERHIYYYPVVDLNEAMADVYCYMDLLFGSGFYYTKSEQYNNVAIFLSKSGRYLTVEWYEGDEESGVPDIIAVLIDTYLFSAEELAEINFSD